MGEGWVVGYLRGVREVGFGIYIEGYLRGVRRVGFGIYIVGLFRVKCVDIGLFF